VKKDTTLFVLDPVLAPLEQIQLATLKRGIEAELVKAQKGVATARADLERVSKLQASGLQQKQVVEQAQLRYDTAIEDEAAATAKLKLLSSNRTTVPAPLTGTALAVPVSPGQFVQAGAPLATVADLSSLWVRVPVPEYDLPGIEARRPTNVQLRSAGVAFTRADAAKADHGYGRLFPAKPVALVPVVDPVKHTADLLYELFPYSWEALAGDQAGASAAGWPKSKGEPAAAPGRKPARTFFAKDQMVTVFVPLGKQSKESVVPYSAVVYDSHGGAWIYLDRTPEKASKRQYERRRVEVGPTVEGGVVVRPTAAAGDRVVTAGAALLFSREFHSTPVHP
jgi:multidrug efflux pump subunit AcrA (membrane-fusion protein)